MRGNAEQLNLSATMINLGGTASTGIGYDTGAKYIIPDFAHRDQSLQFAVGAIKQSLLAYDQTAEKRRSDLEPQDIGYLEREASGPPPYTKQLLKRARRSRLPFFAALPLGSSLIPRGFLLTADGCDPRASCLLRHRPDPLAAANRTRPSSSRRRLSPAILDLHRFVGGAPGLKRPCAARARRKLVRHSEFNESIQS